MRAEPIYEGRPGGVGKKLRDDPDRRQKFRIAIAFDKPHPDLLLRELTYPQWAELLAFCELEPIGDERADIRSGMVAMDLLNSQGVKPRVKIDRYMPFRTKQEKTDDEIWRTFESMFPDNGSGSSDQHELHSDHGEPGEEHETR